MQQNETEDEPPEDRRAEFEEIVRGLKELHASRDNSPGTLIEFAADAALRHYTFVSFRDNGDICVFWADKGHYVLDGEGTIKEFCQRIFRLAGCKRSLSTHAINEVVGHVQRSTYTERDTFCEPPNLIMFANGIYDLNTGNFEPPSPDYKFLSKLAVEYKPGATCPKIDKFFSEIVRLEDVPVLYENAGYCLYREYPIQKIIILNGEGCNGKSTFIRLLAAFLGKENIASVSMQQLENDRFAKVQLYQKHANLFADLPPDALKRTSAFKMLTGGDIINGEQKFKNPFPFVNFAKNINSGNRLPPTPDDTDAFFRRLGIVDFPFSFEGRENPNLINELTIPEEMSGLLNKALPALKQLLAHNKFSNSKSTEELRDIYTRKSDSVKAFFDDCLDTSIEGFVEKDLLLSRYALYCQTTHTIKRSDMTFWDGLRKLAPMEEERPRINGVRKRVLKGIVLKLNGPDVQGVQGLLYFNRMEEQKEVKVSKTLDRLDTPAISDAKTATFTPNTTSDHEKEPDLRSDSEGRQGLSASTVAPAGQKKEVLPDA